MKGTNRGCRLEEASTISITVTEAIEIEIKHSLIINLFIKKKTKEILKCLMSVLISDEDAVKLYVQFFRPK